jgi:hypothetical protein
MGNRVNACLILGLIAGLPTLACALDVGGSVTEVSKGIAAVFKLIFGLLLAISIIYLLVKKK